MGPTMSCAAIPRQRDPVDPRLGPDYATGMQITTETRALVTGANGGLGSAIARALHAAGATVVVTGRRADALRPLAEAIGARTVVADLADRASVARCMDEAGPVDVLVA